MVYRCDSFVESSINPITNSGYDDAWVIAILTHNPVSEMIVGAEKGCAYTIRVGKFADDNWHYRIGDFIGYNEAIGKNIILVMSESEYHEMREKYGKHCFDEACHRAYEPVVLIHSTSIESFERIVEDGSLKSWNRLKKEQRLCEEHPIGLELGDPEEFRDYIMFGGFGVSGEIVVSSRQYQYINMNPDAEYRTGARLYFDARKMAQDGLLVRDGAHLKVKHELLLKPYLIWKATWRSIGLEKEISTPRFFAESSDKKIREKFSKCFFGNI